MRWRRNLQCPRALRGEGTRRVRTGTLERAVVVISSTYSSGVERGAEARGESPVRVVDQSQAGVVHDFRIAVVDVFRDLQQRSGGGRSGVNRRQIEVKRGGERNYGDDISRRFEVSDTSIGRSATRAACKSLSSAPSAFCSTRFSSD